MTTDHVLRSNLGIVGSIQEDWQSWKSRYSPPLFVAAIASWSNRFGLRQTIFQMMQDSWAKQTLLKRARELDPSLRPDQQMIERWLDYSRNEWPRVFREVHGYDLQPDQIIHKSDLQMISDRDPAFGPSIEFLLQRAENEGLKGDDRFAFVERWGEDCPAQQVLAGLDKDKDNKRRMKAELAIAREWIAPQDTSSPWAFVSDGNMAVRLNDFPDDILYTLFRDGQVVGHFSDWPKSWTRIVEAQRPKPKAQQPAQRTRVPNRDAHSVYQTVIANDANQSAAAALARVIAGESSLFLEAVEAWSRRYDARMGALTILKDAAAKRILLERNRDLQRHPQEDAQELIARWQLESRRFPIYHANSVAGLRLESTDPAYGRSFPTLWKLALQHDPSVPPEELVFEWMTTVPAETPSTSDELGILRSEIAWQKTGSAGGEAGWISKDGMYQVVVNDFPDEAFYTLFENSVKICSFDDWPAKWLRG